MFSTQAPDSYNLFLSSAVTDGVKIWDLRTLRLYYYNAKIRPVTVFIVTRPSRTESVPWDVAVIKELYLVLVPLQT